MIAQFINSSTALILAILVFTSNAKAGETAESTLMDLVIKAAASISKNSPYSREDLSRGKLSLRLSYHYFRTNNYPVNIEAEVFSELAFCRWRVIRSDLMGRWHYLELPESFEVPPAVSAQEFETQLAKWRTLLADENAPGAKVREVEESLVQMAQPHIAILARELKLDSKITRILNRCSFLSGYASNASHEGDGSLETEQAKWIDILKSVPVSDSDRAPNQNGADAKSGIR